MPKKTAARTAGKNDPAKTGAPKTRRSRNRLRMVRDLIAKWSAEMESSQTKSGVAELARLLSLERELSASKETVRKIEVTWVEPKTTESKNSE